MKLSKATRDILTNFSSIGKGIIFRPGNVLATQTNLTSMFGIATVAETFPVKAPIFNLRRLLDAMSIFDDDADLDFKEKYVEISDASGKRKAKTRYIYSAESLVVAPPEKLREQPPSDVNFDLTDENRKLVLSAVSALNVKDIAIRAKEGVIYMCAYDAKENIDQTDLFSVEVGKCDEDFQFNFPTDLFNILPGDYKAGIYFGEQRGSLRLNRADDLRYLIAGTTKHA